MGWEPVAVIEGGVVSFVRTDHIGRPVFATNAAGAKAWTASYTPFGGVRTTTGTPINARFLGQWFQSESGLHQNWMWDYDPTTGRYLQADPLGLIAGGSVYGYAQQSPGRWMDPRGEDIIALTDGGWIFNRDWIHEPSLPAKIGTRFSHACSDAVLEFHRTSLTNTRAHWHYYPDGLLTTGRKARLSRWFDMAGNDHLYPPYLLDVEDCPCGGGTIPNPTPVFGAALLFLLLLGGGLVLG